MKFFKSYFSVFALVFLCHYTTAAKAADNVTARHAEEEAFAHSYAQTVLAIIQDQKKSYSDRKDVLRTAFAQSVDIDWIARFVLGKTWATATKEQRESYISLYRQYLTETYVANFAENPEKRIRDIKIYGVNDSEEADDNDFTVRTQMMLADRENLQVNYLVRAEGGKYKVRDIAIENVSLIATHRSEFTEIAVSKGLDGVIAELQQRVNHSNAITLSMN